MGTIHTGVILLLIAAVLWVSTEVVEFALRRRANETIVTSTRPVPAWLRGLNVLALIVALAGFVMLFTLDERFWGPGG